MWYGLRMLGCLSIVVLICLAVPCGAQESQDWVVLGEHPENVTLAVGDGASFNLWIKNTHPSQSFEVRLEVSGLPEGVACVSEPTNVPPNSSVVCPITLRTDDNVAEGSYPLQIREDSDGTSSIDVMLQVVEGFVSPPEDVVGPLVEEIPPEEIESSITIEGAKAPPQPNETETRQAQTPAFEAVMLVGVLGMWAVLGRKR